MLSESSIRFLLLNQEAWVWGFRLVEQSSRRMGERFGLHKMRTKERQYSLPFHSGSGSESDATTPVGWNLVVCYFPCNPPLDVRGRPKKEEVFDSKKEAYESRSSTDNSTHRGTRTTRSARPFLLDIRKPSRALRGRHS